MRETFTRCIVIYMNNAAALTASSAIVADIAERIAATLTTPAEGVHRAQLRKGPLFVQVLPTYTATEARVVFTKAQGYNGLDDAERTYTDAISAAADVAIFFATGAL